MAITVLETPNQFNYAKQTIPFMVKSTLIAPGTAGSIDPIEKAFRFIFDVVVQNDLGYYYNYASVGIPPRPDNFFGFIDVAPMILDAIRYDLSTHKQTYASPCPKSIAKFKVYCTERYLDVNGNFISGTKISLGEYYAIDGAGNEGISPYLIDSFNVKKPLHHHSLAGEDLKVKANEPMTLSWLSKNDLGVNELEYIHGNYGTFSDIATVGTASTSNVLNVYSGITKNALTTVTPGTLVSLGGGASLLTSGTNYSTSGNTNRMVFKFTNLVLDANKVYVFKFWALHNGAPLPASSNYKIRATPVGTNFTSITGLDANINATNNTWVQFSTTFAATSLYSPGDIEIEIRYVSTSALSPLSQLNNMTMYFDNASIYQTTNSAPYVSTIEVITDDNTVWAMPSGYTQNILPLNDTSQSRFDTPIGPYKIYNSTAQDAVTGFWKNTGGAIAKWFQVRVKNNVGNTIGLSERIYQDQVTCSVQNNFRLKWKNQLGGWDYFTFTKVTRATTAIERENFKQTRGNFTATSYQELTTDRGYQSLNIKLQDTYTVISDWIDDNTAKWMLDLFTSDEVYLLNPEPFQMAVVTNEYDLEYPVFVKQNDVEFMNDSIEAKLKNFVIDITPAIAFIENTTN